MISELKLEDAAYFDFVTHHPGTAAVTDADSTPSAEVFEDATDTTVVALTVTKRTSKTGNYRVPITAAAASGFEAGKTYNVVASATVNSIAGKGVIGRFKVRARAIDDLAFPATSGRSTDIDASGRVLLQPTQAGVTIPTVTTLTGYTTPPTVGAIADAVLDEALSGHTTVGSLGQRLQAPASGTAQAGSASSITLAASPAFANDKLKYGLVLLTSGTGAGQFAAITGNVGQVASITPNWVTNPSSDTGYVVLPAGTLATPTAAEIADAVLDEQLSGHLAAGSAGAALNGAGSAGDPWTTSLPGAYGAGTAGKILGDNLNATVGSRATQTSVDDLPTNAELATALASADDAVLAAVAALNNLSAAGIRTAVGLATANLDTQLAAQLAAQVTAAAIRTEINANGNHVKVGTPYVYTNAGSLADETVTITAVP